MPQGDLTAIDEQLNVGRPNFREKCERKRLLSFDVYWNVEKELIIRLFS